MNLLGWLVPSWAIALAAALAGAALGGGVQQLRIASLQTEHAQYREKQALALAAAEKAARLAQEDLQITRNQLTGTVAGIDQRMTKAREDAAKETETRLRGMAAGAVRVRYVAASCPNPGGAVPAAAASPGLADAAGIDLAPEAGQDVQLLRQSLADDAIQIGGFKQYARAVADYNRAVTGRTVTSAPVFPLPGPLPQAGEGVNSPPAGAGGGDGHGGH
ncbi:MAG: lysis protein [Burkholderiaceae bacterium]|jgi:hypothetical protein|nr:lysis protein [Burkholderiaceae bacterium]